MKLNKLFTIGLSSVLLSAITSAEEDKEKKPAKAPKIHKAFEIVDTDNDGKISLEEFSVDAKNAKKAKKRFAKKDKNADNFLNKEEYAAKRKGKKGPKKPKKDKDPS